MVVTMKCWSWPGILAAVLFLTMPLAAADKPLIVYTVNYPLQYFAQRIAGDRAEVVFPAPADLDPAFWTPEAEDITDYQNADLVLLNGAGYAKWVDRASLPRRTRVNTSAAFSDELIETQSASTHSHGREGEHSHAGTAFTTWLDLRLALEQAKAIRDALTKTRPEDAETFHKNFQALEGDLQKLHARLESLAESNPNPHLVVSHPVYQYLARGYGLNLTAVLWEPHTMPSESQWRELESILEQNPAEWMLWEDEPIDQSLDRLEELGVRSTVFSPLGNVPETGDFITVMSGNIENLEKALAAQGDAGGPRQP